MIMKSIIGMKKYGKIGYLPFELKFVTESVESAFGKGMGRNTPRRTYSSIAHIHERIYS
jgi:hypothetical protein